MPSELLQLGAVGVVFGFAIREFFSWLKTRNGTSNPTPATFSKAILEELQLMNSNHLHSIQSAIEKGNDRLIDVIHNDNIKIVELLAEIRGILRK